MPTLPTSSCWKTSSCVFSTDPSRPLTVIRAANGSGKTSILQALRWGMWGEKGIPPGMRLTSTSVSVGESALVQVSVDFSERDTYSGEETRYRLIRTCKETRGEGDDYERAVPRERLLKLTDQGAVDIEEGRQARVSAMMPLSLADVFFTDGDSVQNFVSGIHQSERDRQEYVHQAIRQLLGFEESNWLKGSWEGSQGVSGASCATVAARNSRLQKEGSKR